MNVTYEGENQKIIERFLLTIYSIYNIVILTVSAESEWDYWLVLFILFGMSCSWIINISKYRDYKFRAVFMAVMMQGSMILYAINSEEYEYTLPVFIVFVVFLGLYGLPKIIYLTVVSAIIIFVYHVAIVKSMPFGTVEEISNALLQLGNIFLVEYVVYIWTKRNREGSMRLLAAIEELKGVENSKDDFLANVSHEIRTPINTICGMSEIVLSEELSYRTRENVLGIQIAGRNLMSVVSDILDFSELQSGKMEVEEEAYNITSTVNDVINMTMARKNEKKIQLIVDCDANIPRALLGDEKKLRRVIMNLVDNAIKFTEAGCVSITIGYRKESYGINLVVTVKDTGIGMEEESLEKLFTSFNQVDASRRRHEGGIGLGLAISQALVQKMGGAITVKSQLGKGSTVKFVIPQKVLDEKPIVSIRNKESVKVATYIDMEQFDMATIRDEYSKNIMNMVEQLKVRCHICRNLAELQRRQEKEHFSHIFISILEYRENQEYFDKLSWETKVIVVLDHYDEKYVTNPNLLKVYKPFYILTIVSVVNGLYDAKDEKNIVSTEKFETRNAHVLVVDDNRMNIRVIEGLLEYYKIKVTIATSGQEALEKIVAADYDFVFMDHMMPEMDGVETLQRIRHKVGAYYQKVPVIALTANAVAGTREMLMAKGFNDFLEKPIERSVLERVLKRNLSPEKIVIKDMYNRSTLLQEQSIKIGNLSVMTEENKANTQDTEEKRIAVQYQQEEQMDNNDKEQADTQKRPKEWEKELLEEGLDVQKGILYCNGIDQYIKILQGYCEDCDDSGVLAQQLFEKQDWKNYVIAVHGMKSAMRSIGAMEISELARLLESAGKEGRMDYILENHEKLIEEYKKLFVRLRKKEWLCPVAEAEEREEKEEAEGKNSSLLELEDSIFERMIEEMEEVMYTLDGDRLMEILTELQQYQYKGTSLKPLLVSVRRKVEMSDYVSAVEMIVRLKDKLADKEGGAEACGKS